MDESHAAGAPTRASSSPSVIVVLDAAAGVLALAELSATEALLGEKRPAPDVRENGDAPAPPPVEKRLTEAANALPSVGSGTRSRELGGRRALRARQAHGSGGGCLGSVEGADVPKFRDTCP